MASAKRSSVGRWFVAAALALASIPAMAQSPPPLAQPNVPLLTNGAINAIARTSDGGIIIGGDFTSVGGAARSNLARFRPDGTLDASWNASTNGPVNALALDASGNLFVGGLFDDASGQGRFCLAKFSAAGAVDVAWTAWADAPVLAVAVADDSVFIGGYFLSVATEPRSRLAKLSATGAGALDESWVVPANNRVIALQAGASGTLYAAGAFTSIGDANTSYLAKISTSGAGEVDATWAPAPDDWVMALAIDGDAVYAAGYFTSIGGQVRGHLARIAAVGDGTADPVWAPTLDNVPYAVAIGTDDSVYAGGFFHEVNGVARAHVAKVSAEGAGDVVTDWDASTDGRVFAVQDDGQGRVYVGGMFSRAAGMERHSVAQVNAASGAPAAAFDATEAGKAWAFALQPDGGAIVAGRFFSAGGQPRGGLLRLRPDGSLDPTWTPSIASSQDAAIQVGALALDTNGDVYIGGLFDHVNGVARSNLAKLGGGNGAVDPTWNPSADSYVDALVLDGSGSLYAGGQFTQVGSQPRNYLAKMSAAGSGAVDPTWNPSPDWYVYNITRDAQGALYVGGDFATIGGVAHAYAAKLAPGGTGAADANWNPSPDSTVFALVPDNQGSVFAGGWFYTVGGASRMGLAKLDAVSGAADATWNPATALPGAAIYAMALDSDSLYVGGSFSELGGIAIDSLAKLSTTGAGDPDPSFNPGVNGGPNGSEGLLNLTLGNGVLYAGGGFTMLGGEARAGLAALPVGAVPPSSIGHSTHISPPRR